MQQMFLLQILLLAQHVSGTTMPIIRSSRVLYSGCCLWYFVLWFFKLLVWCGAEGYVSGLQDAAASEKVVHSKKIFVKGLKAGRNLRCQLVKYNVHQKRDTNAIRFEVRK